MDIKSLREIHRKERMSPYLSNVGKDFYREVEGCIRDVDEKLEEAKDDKSRLAVLLGERETLKNTIQDIFEIRERKIVTNALYYAKSGEEIELENLTTEEEGMLKRICEVINGYRKGLLEGLLSGGGEIKIKSPKKREVPLEVDEKKKIDYLTVRILQDLPPISGIDGKVYGSFKVEDVVTMPKKNASVLLGKGAAEPIHQGAQNI
jgi:DNA replication initiation complex subunit (GINS family)